MIELQKERPKRRSSAVELPERAPEKEEEEERIFVCRSCQTEITSRRQLFAMRASSYVQVFPNPYGHMKVIYTFRDARAVRVAGEATSEFTWFAGYSWRVGYCAACNHHLGWLFETFDGSEPPAFYGLLKEELIEVDEPRAS